MYGSRLDFVLLDDIVEDYQPRPNRSGSSRLLGRVQSRLPADGKVTLLATRVHEQDLCSHFLDDSNSGPPAEQAAAARVERGER